MKNIAIVGATGAVGVELLECLDKRQFPIASLRLFASSKSVGKIIEFKGTPLTVEALSLDSDFTNLDMALFAAGSRISKQYAPLFAKAGCLVIDNSSAFRMDSSVPLIVPEVNAQDATSHHHIIANPNCSTIIASLPLKAINDINPLVRVIISTYQAASGAGAAGMEELIKASEAYLENEPFTHHVFPHPYAFNLFSHNTPIGENGYNEEEMKMTHETRKIMGLKDLRISATCIRVPVLRTHCESINIECENPVDLNIIRQQLANFPGIQLVDNQIDNVFPMPSLTSGQDQVLVGRLRHDISDPTQKSFWIWVSGDQLLKGAALNAVQIAELFI